MRVCCRARGMRRTGPPAPAAPPTSQGCRLLAHGWAGARLRWLSPRMPPPWPLERCVDYHTTPLRPVWPLPRRNCNPRSTTIRSAEGGPPVRRARSVARATRAAGRLCWPRHLPAPDAPNLLCGREQDARRNQACAAEVVVGQGFPQRREVGKPAEGGKADASSATTASMGSAKTKPSWHALPTPCITCSSVQLCHPQSLARARLWRQAHACKCKEGRPSFTRTEPQAATQPTPGLTPHPSTPADFGCMGGCMEDHCQKEGQQQEPAHATLRARCLPPHRRQVPRRCLRRPDSGTAGAALQFSGRRLMLR